MQQIGSAHVGKEPVRAAWILHAIDLNTQLFRSACVLALFSGDESVFR